MYNAEGIIQTFQNYTGVTVYIPIFLVCVLFCYCTGNKDSKTRLLVISVLSVICLFNNFSMKIVGKVTELSTYYRFIWAIPVLLVIAYVVTRVVAEREKLLEKLVVLAVVFVVFWGWKSSFITEGSFRLPENAYNLPNDVIGVCKIIEQDKMKECPVVACDLDVQLPIRTYDASIIWGISRNAYLNHNDMETYENAGRYRNEKVLIHAVNYGMKEESEALAEALSKKKVDYMVTLTSFEMDAYFEKVGYELIGVSGGRSVYARMINEEAK